jgi:hypothetical protein
MTFFFFSFPIYSSIPFLRQQFDVELSLDNMIAVIKLPILWYLIHGFEFSARRTTRPTGEYRDTHVTRSPQKT